MSAGGMYVPPKRTRGLREGYRVGRATYGADPRYPIVVHTLIYYNGDKSRVVRGFSFRSTADCQAEINNRALDGGADPKDLDRISCSVRESQPAGESIK